MIGVIFLLHFGTFHLLSLGWRRLGVNAMPLMRNPSRSTSLAEFWGRRWNTAFHELAARFTFRPLRRLVGAGTAASLVFLVSGLIHELVISLPAGGGYGLPTLYSSFKEPASPPSERHTAGGLDSDVDYAVGCSRCS